MKYYSIYQLIKEYFKLMALDKTFQPKHNFELVRVGKKNDGGYLIGKNSLLYTKNLVSFGIDDDWSFEKTFLKVNKNVKLFTFDQNLDAIFLLKRIILNFFRIFSLTRKSFFTRSINNFFDYFLFLKKNNKKKNIYYNDTKEITKNVDNIFLKIDIEGSEYRVLDDLIEIQNKIQGAVIEFHYFDLLSESVKKFIQNFNLELVHIHPNNYGPVDKNGDPVTVELTFEKNFQILNENIVLPNKLDMKNDPHKDDINLTFN